MKGRWRRLSRVHQALFSSSGTDVPVERIRNLGIIAHIDAGKTTTTERMIFYSGRTRRIGEVDRGDTVMDFLPEERERGITIAAAAVTFPWKKHRINLIDTPGHVDFGMEVERCLRVMDAAVAIIDASAGVQAQTKTVWRQTAKFGIPRLIYVNKMDHVGADFDGAVRDVGTKLSDLVPVCLQRPIARDGRFAMIADLVKRKTLVWREDQGKTVEEHPWSAQDETLCDARGAMLEQIAGLDGVFLEEYLEKWQDSSVEGVMSAIRRLTFKNSISPVLCGSSFTNVGVQPILDSILDYFPSPAERPMPPVFTRSGTQVQAFPAERLLALAFKVTFDERRGVLVFVRVYSGVLAGRVLLRNTTQGVQERPLKLMTIFADQFEECDQVCAGNVAVLAGLKKTRTGDTLMAECDARTQECQLIGIKAPEPVFTCSVEAESSSGEVRLEEALRIIELEDPSVRISRDTESGQKHLSGMGELHLEIVSRRITRDLKADAVFGKVQISYKEQLVLPQVQAFQETVRATICGAKISGIVRLSAALSLENSQQLPQVTLGDFDLCRTVELQEAVSDGILSALQEGPLASFPVIGARVRVESIEWVEGTCTAEGLSYIAYKGMRHFLCSVRARLSEPVMAVEIVAPDEYLGAILTDVHSGRRGQVIEVAAVGTREHKIQAEIPLAELLDYASHLRSKTAGSGSFEMQPLCYRTMSHEEEQSVLDALGIVRNPCNQKNLYKI